MRSNLPSHLDPRHPVLLQEYAVFTPPVHAMAQTIGDWIDQRQPGGYIHGPSRFGKSRGVKWHLKNVLEDRFGNVFRCTFGAVHRTATSTKKSSGPRSDWRQAFVMRPRAPHAVTAAAC